MNQFTNVPLRVDVDYSKPLDEALGRLKCHSLDGRINGSNFRLQLDEDSMPDGPTRVMFFKLIEVKSKRPLLPMNIETLVRRKGYSTPAVLEVCSMGDLLTSTFLTPPVVVPDLSMENNYIPVLAWDWHTRTRNFLLKFWMDIRPDEHQYLVIRR